MAYAATITITRRRDLYTVTIAETEGASGSEATIDLGAEHAVVVLDQRAVLSAGSAATIDPMLATSSGASAGDYDVIVENGTAASSVRNQVPYSGQPIVTDKLYHQSKPNTGSDNTITTIYTMRVS